MGFEGPVFTLWGVIYTAAGAAIYWNWLGRDKLEAFSLSRTWSLLPINSVLRSILEFLIFIILGVLIGIGFTNPKNPRQAITAGFAWTSVFGAVKKPTTRSRQNAQTNG